MFETLCRHKRGFPGGSDGKESACDAGDRVQSLGREDPLEEEVATHSSILAWRIPWTEEPGRLQSMGSQRIRHETEQLSIHAYRHKYTDLFVRRQVQEYSKVGFPWWSSG